MKKILAILAVSVLSIAGAQAAEMSEVDANGDGIVSMDEAKAALQVFATKILDIHAYQRGSDPRTLLEQHDKRGEEQEADTDIDNPADTRAHAL